MKLDSLVDVSSKKRPCPISKADVAAIVADVSRGVPWKVAATARGLPRASLTEWLRLGRTMHKAMIENGAFPERTGPLEWTLYELAVGIDKAHAEFVRRQALKIGAGAKKSVEWASWVLEKRATRDYGEAEEVDGASPLSTGPRIQIYAPVNARGHANG